MNPHSVLVKTDRGADEIETRRHRLDHRLRALLLVINGAVTVAELCKNFARFGNVPSMLQQLAADGFVEEPAADGGFQTARRELAALVMDSLGPESLPMAAEIEKCASKQALRAYLESQRQLFDISLNKTKAAKFWEMVDRLAG
jgi:hypothetical protein